jgi:hypothetical protein
MGAEERLCSAARGVLIAEPHRQYLAHLDQALGALLVCKEHV